MKVRPQIKYSFIFFLLMGVLARVTQQSDMDIALSQFFFDHSSANFPYQHHFALDFFGTKMVWWIPFGGAVLMAWIAWRGERGSVQQWAYAAAAVLMGTGPLLAGVLKHLTAMPRPIHAQVFAGSDAMPTYFWAKSLHMAGNALPSAHASAGFVLIALFFVGSLHHNKKLMWVGLWLGLLAGIAFGVMRIIQGYHFLSQVLWSCSIIGLYACVIFAAADWGRDKYLHHQTGRFKGNT